MTYKISFVLSLVLGLTIGCDRQEKSSGGVADNFPKLVGGEGDATAPAKVGVVGENGGKNIVVDLEKLPEYGSANLWACYNTPADDFVFGKAVCTSDAAKNADLVAANIDFTCGVNPDFGTRKATKPLDLSACDSYEVISFVFNPKLNIRISD